MREIEAQIFTHLNLTTGKSSEKIDVASTEPLLVETFSDLVKKIATLSFHNKDHLLFFRGQKRDHLNRKKNSSFYPSIYRTKNGENLSKELLAIGGVLSPLDSIVVTESSVLRINFCAKKPAHRQSATR
jgi:hypothetical protein